MPKVDDPADAAICQVVPPEGCRVVGVGKRSPHGSGVFNRLSLGSLPKTRLFTLFL